jgi:iron complex outermembrane receptor protein
VRWRPIEDLLLRGTYAQGFRAPTLSDLYSGMSQSFETFLDPCDSAYGAAGSNPTVAARCAAAGVPANYHQRDQNGVAIDSNNGGQTPTPFDSVSNPKLKPETSVTRTFGLVYSPHYVDGLDITLDYYDIRLTNAIQYVDASQILNFCYVQNLPGYCADFGRNSNGSIAWLNEGLVNLGSINTTGYDFGIHYRLPETSFGRFRLSSDSSYLTQYQVNNGPGAPPQNLAGYMYGEDDLYRLRSNFQVDWNYRQFGASWTVRYYAGLKDTCFTTDPAMECSFPDTLNQSALVPGVSRKGSVAFNDAQFRYTTPWQGVFSVGVNNLFNKRGPYYYSVATSGSGSPPYNAAFDVDRFFYLQYSQKFDL